MLNKIFSDILKNPKQMIALVAVAALIVLAVYFNFLIKPQVVGIAGVMGKLHKANSDLKTAETDIARINKMKESIAAYNEKVGKYEKLLPTKEGVPAILESLSEMAKNANMRIVGIIPIERKSSNPKDRVYQEMPIAISAKGGYHELGRFMSSLENSDRFMKIADIQIRYNNSTPRKQDIELLAVTYILLEGK